MHAGHAIVEAKAVEGAELGRWLLESGDYVLGTAPDCALRLIASGVSRHHLELSVLPDGGVLLSDLASTNGTVVGAHRIRRMAITQPTRAHVGSAILTIIPDSRDDQVLALPESVVRRTPRGLLPLAQATSLLAPGWAIMQQAAEWLADANPAALADLLSTWIDTLQVRALLIEDQAVIAAAGDLRDGEALVVKGRQLSLRIWIDPDVSDAETETGDWSGPRTLPLRVVEALTWSIRAIEYALAAAGMREATHQQTPSSDIACTADWPTQSAAMREVVRIGQRIAEGDVPMLIRGPSGSGKEVFARWLHAQSPRRSGPFVALNCAALPAELLEAEIFGIERGVATGVDARAGVLERAAGGTLFLDELGDMAPITQAKLLRALEAHEIFRVGGRNPIRIDVRLLSATHRDLEAGILDGSFRLDLYHRLAGVDVSLPALKERPEDIPMLSARLLSESLSELGRRSPGISMDAMHCLLAHSWPGNVRELRNEMRRAALVMASHQPLDVPMLSPRIRGPLNCPEKFSLDSQLIEAEGRAFQVALAIGRGDHVTAMRHLQVSRSSYFRRLRALRELGVVASDPDDPARREVGP